MNFDKTKTTGTKYGETKVQKKRQKKREKQFAAMATNCGTLYYVGMCLLDLVDMMRAFFCLILLL